MSNMVITMRSLKARVICHDIMSMANYMQKGTPATKIFKSKSVSSGWYQAWLSRMIARGTLKISSWNISHDLTQEAWCTSSNLEASYSLHASELVKSGIAEYNTSYYKTVEV